MTTREMATQYKMVQWRQIIQERTASGMNIKEFCEQRGKHTLLADQVARDCSTAIGSGGGA